jgi:hypothetical protein
VSRTIALAQSQPSSETPDITTIKTGVTTFAVGHTWEAAQSTAPHKGKIFVITVDQPNRRQSCRIQSFTQDKLVCSRAVGSPRTFFPQQVTALILPGDDALRRRILIELNGGLGAAIWGSVVLAAACPACAAATAFAALVCFCFAGAVGFTDDQPDRLLYLARDQELSHKLGYVQE